MNNKLIIIVISFIVMTMFFKLTFMQNMYFDRFTNISADTFLLQ